MPALKKIFGLSQPDTFTVAQACAITGVSPAQINQYIDRDLAGLDLVVAGAGERRIGVQGLLALRLVHDFADTLTPLLRRELVSKALASRRKTSVQLGDGKVSARIDTSRKGVTMGHKAYNTALTQVHTSDEIMGGEPCLKGTRISVYTLAGLLTEAGANEVKQAYPQVSDDQLAAAALYAKAHARKGRPKSVAARLEQPDIKPKRSRTQIIA